MEEVRYMDNVVFLEEDGFCPFCEVCEQLRSFVWQYCLGLTRSKGVAFET